MPTEILHRTKSFSMDGLPAFEFDRREWKANSDFSNSLFIQQASINRILLENDQELLTLDKINYSLERLTMLKELQNR